MAKKLKTFYHYFYKNSKFEVQQVIDKLNYNELQLIKSKFGDDLETPNNIEFNSSESYIFYNKILPKIRKLLSNKKEYKTNANMRFYNDVVNKILLLEYKYSQNKNILNDNILQEDYYIIVNFIKSNLFLEMLKFHSSEESIVLSLKLGYANKKFYSNEAIANFLDVEVSKVNEIFNSLLVFYKKYINDTFVNMINVNKKEDNTNVKKLQK